MAEDANSAQKYGTASVELVAQEFLFSLVPVNCPLHRLYAPYHDATHPWMIEEQDDSVAEP
ncbi:hypothetical protein M378DRAFT_17580 [Amanita muscaria Koide BX008]|uniref:Uncharacterized protein n=1 Tax=Amanita muscaria (strain Koide BX008) TaxID=946122 RepID=A0A0C2WI73_AMAMK|nr:hypothetical protein M378DRAFT_17580 [Amanita muscaria Koide BX008]